MLDVLKFWITEKRIHYQFLLNTSLVWNACIPNKTKLEIIRSSNFRDLAITPNSGLLLSLDCGTIIVTYFIFLIS